MKNAWLNRIIGFVEVQVKGIGAERFVNLLVRDRVFIRNMRREEKDQVVFQIRLDQVSLLRKNARKSNLKFRFTKRMGLPFLLNRFRLNKGLFLGIFFFLAIIFVLSNIVWSIKIDGASLKTEQVIRQELEKLDVKVGKFNFLEGNVNDVQKHITNTIPNITWIGVQIRGSIYHLQVVEKKQPKPSEDTSYPQLVASKKAYIVSTFIETGQVQVVPTQMVEKGQVLVSGSIGNNDKKTYVGAKGTVLGETWYQSTSEVPIHTSFSTLTGHNKSEVKVNLFGADIPIWGFWKSKFKAYHKDDNTTYFHFWKWKLPFSITNTSIQESVQSKRKLTFDEATEIALENARVDLRKNLPMDAEIVKENILQKQVSNDKVVVSVHFEVIENIAEGLADPGALEPQEQQLSVEE